MPKTSPRARVREARTGKVAFGGSPRGTPSLTPRPPLSPRRPQEAQSSGRALLHSLPPELATQQLRAQHPSTKPNTKELQKVEARGLTKTQLVEAGDAVSNDKVVAACGALEQGLPTAAMRHFLKACQSQDAQKAGLLKEDDFMPLLRRLLPLNVSNAEAETLLARYKVLKGHGTRRAHPDRTAAQAEGRAYVPASHPLSQAEASVDYAKLMKAVRPAALRAPSDWEPADSLAVTLTTASPRSASPRQPSHVEEIAATASQAIRAARTKGKETETEGAGGNETGTKTEKDGAGSTSTRPIVPPLNLAGVAPARVSGIMNSLRMRVGLKFLRKMCLRHYPDSYHSGVMSASQFKDLLSTLAVGMPESAVEEVLQHYSTQSPRHSSKAHAENRSTRSDKSNGRGNEDARKVDLASMAEGLGGQWHPEYDDSELMAKPWRRKGHRDRGKYNYDDMVAGEEGQQFWHDLVAKHPALVEAIPNTRLAARELFRELDTSGEGTVPVDVIREFLWKHIRKSGKPQHLKVANSHSLSPQSNQSPEEVKPNTLSTQASSPFRSSTSHASYASSAMTDVSEWGFREYRIPRVEYVVDNHQTLPTGVQGSGRKGVAVYSGRATDESNRPAAVQFPAEDVARAQAISSRGAVSRVAKDALLGPGPAGSKGVQRRRPKGRLLVVGACHTPRSPRAHSPLTAAPAAAASRAPGTVTLPFVFNGAAPLAAGVYDAAPVAGAGCGQGHEHLDDVSMRPRVRGVYEGPLASRNEAKAVIESFLERLVPPGQCVLRVAQLEAAADAVREFSNQGSFAPGRPGMEVSKAAVRHPALELALESPHARVHALMSPMKPQDRHRAATAQNSPRVTRFFNSPRWIIEAAAERTTVPTKGPMYQNPHDQGRWVTSAREQAVSGLYHNKATEVVQKDKAKWESIGQRKAQIERRVLQAYEDEEKAQERKYNRKLQAKKAVLNAHEMMLKARETSLKAPKQLSPRAIAQQATHFEF